MAKILCIANDDSVLKMLDMDLSKNDHEVLLANNVKAGIETFKIKCPQIVVVDILIPDMSAIDVLKTVKNIISDTEVIFITNDENINLSINALQEGAFDYFTKPIDFKRLNHSISMALGKQDIQKQFVRYSNDLEKNIAEKMQEIELRQQLENALNLRIMIETVVSGISANFIGMNLDNLDKEFNNALLLIGQTISVDRIFFYRLSANELSFDLQYEWSTESVKKRTKLIKIYTESFPWFVRKIKALDTVFMNDLDKLPDEARYEKLSFYEDQIKSSISVPVKYGDTLVGFIGLDSVTKLRDWTDTEVRILNMAANIFINAIQHKRAMDISLRQQEKLIQADKMASVGTMAAGVAHEINNPLNVAVGDIYILKRDFKSLKDLLDMYSKGVLSKEVEKFEKDEDIPYVLENLDKKISRMEGAMLRIQGIVESMKEFSHLDSKDVTLVGINHHIEKTLLFIPKKYKHDIEIVTVFGILPDITCNGRQINQVFLNIIINALQAMDDKGKLTLETGVDGGNIFIKASDTGPGIAGDKLKSIFDPFFTTKPVGDGTGLGLSISYAIIKEHGGEISVANNPDRGATFTITLPIL